MLSFRRTVITTILLATVLPSTMVAAYLLHALYDTTSQNAIRELDLRASQAAAVLEQHLSRTTLDLASLAATSDLAFSASSILFEGVAMDLLRHYQVEHSLVTQVAVLDTAGKLVFKLHQANDANQLGEAVAQVRPHLGEKHQVLSSPATTRGLIYLAPLLLHRSNNVASPEVNGFVVAIIDPKQIIKKWHDTGIEPLGIRLVLGAKTIIGGSASDQQPTQSMESATKLIPLPGDHTLQLTLSSPADVVFAPVKADLWTALGGVLVMVLAMLALAMIVSRRMASSLKGLEGCMESYQQGVPVGPIDMRYAEFARLKTLLDHLTTSLEDYRRRSVMLSRQAAVGEMIQMLAHDIRKPFSLMRMGLNMLNSATSEASLRDLLPKVTSRVEQSLQSVHAMLADTMAMADHAQLKQEDAGLPALIKSCLDDLLPALSGSEISFEYLIEGHPVLYIDEVKIRRVMTNIIDNAIQACDRQGTIWFHARASSEPGFIELTIGNNGKCIPEEVQAHIFDAFFTHAKKGGTGLGLAIAKTFIDLHGGTIACASSLERGTEFILKLPGKVAQAA